MTKIVTFLIIVLSINIFAKDEVLYCNEIAKVGFEPQQNYKQTPYTTTRFSVKVNFEKNSFISDSIFFNDFMGVTCKSGATGEMFCTNLNGATFKLLEYGFKFIRTSILVPDSIYIAHGKCEKF